MLSAVAPVVLGLADTVRPLLLMGFVVAMFAVAGIAVLLGKRRIERQQAKALSQDTGVDKGAMRGSDASFSDEWLAETRSQVDDGPKQSWADMILGPGSVHDDGSADMAVVPPEIAAQQRMTVPAQNAWGPGADVAPWAAAVEDPTAAWAAQQPVEPVPPVFVEQPVEPVPPVFVEQPVEPVPPVVGKRAAAPASGEEPSTTDESGDPAPTVYPYAGKRAARQPFMVDAHLEED